MAELYNAIVAVVAQVPVVIGQTPAYVKGIVLAVLPFLAK